MRTVEDFGELFHNCRSALGIPEYNLDGDSICELFMEFQKLWKQTLLTWPMEIPIEYVVFTIEYVLQQSLNENHKNTKSISEAIRLSGFEEFQRWVII
jgi:hypothetical protein